MQPVLGPIAPPALPSSADRTTDRQLMNAAQEMEATFLAEMLKSAGLGEMPSAFGGGPGEEHFASFLRMEQARAMVKAGGIGLAQSIFEAMKDRPNGDV